MPDSPLETLYYRSPLLIQNAVFSAYGYVTARTRYGGGFRRRLAALIASDHRSAGDARRFQDQQVAALVRHAFDTVPFYRRWYTEHGIDVTRVNGVADLCRLPILTKSMVRQSQGEMISSAFSKRRLHRLLTSGTTGTPLAIYRTADSIQFQWAVWSRHKARFGLNHRDWHLVFGARVPVSSTQNHPPFWRRDWANRRVYLSTSHISEGNVDAIVALLDGEHFAYYSGYPSAMNHLAFALERAGWVPKRPPRYLVGGSDALTTGIAARIQRVFRAPVTEQYGMAEFAGNMSKCEHNVFHPDHECCVVENGAEGGEHGRGLILTGWGNAAMPFIRYETGDVGTPLDQACPCGRGDGAFVSIDGRLEDYVMTPDGRRLIGMNQVLEYAPHALEMQIRQTVRSAVEFLVVSDGRFGQSDEDAVRREFTRRAGDGMDITFTRVESIPRTAGGKIRAVQSSVEGGALPGCVNEGH